MGTGAAIVTLHHLMHHTTRTIFVLAELSLIVQVRDHMTAKDSWGRTAVAHAVLSGRPQVFDTVLHALREEIRDDEVGMSEIMILVCFVMEQMNLLERGRTLNTTVFCKSTFLTWY